MNLTIFHKKRYPIPRTPFFYENFMIYSFNIFHNLSFNSVKPCWATDEINIYGTSLKETSSSVFSSAFSSSSSISHFEITNKRSLSNISGLYFVSSFTKISYSALMFGVSTGTRKSKVELRSI